MEKRSHCLKKNERKCNSPGKYILKDRGAVLKWWILRVPWTAKRSNQSILKEINPEYSLEGLMLKLLAVQEALKSLLQHHSSKASILQYSAFFIVQLSQPYMSTRKTVALT